MTMVPDTSAFQRVELDGLAVEFALVSLHEREHVEEELQRIDEALRAIDGRIDLLTDHSDRLDWAVSVAAGVLTGAVDSVWVGEFSLARGREWGSARINDIVLQTASQFTDFTGDDLAQAILALEKKFPFAGDAAMFSFGGSTLHHLRDLTHHPSPIGLVASIVLQFTGEAWGFAGGQLSPVDVTSSGLIGANVPEKLLFGTVRWLMHLVSDIAGSSSSAGAGTGLPGPLLSMLHEAAAGLGKLRDEADRSDFLKWVEGAFRGKNGEVPFDFRTELGLVEEAGRQALPVILNEALVRGFFFVRRAAVALRAVKPRTVRELRKVDLRPALPWRNRTITRMLTIASSTLTAVDLLDATVRAAIASGGDAAKFVGTLVLRVNFVGVARTSVAIGFDVHQGVLRSRQTRARVALVNEQLALLDARISYAIDDAWQAADSVTAALHATNQALEAAVAEFDRAWMGIDEDSVVLAREIEAMRTQQHALPARALADLNWGVDE